MPIYDCGDPWCEECQKAFGPDRSKAIAAHIARELEYSDRPMTADDNAKIDAAWKRHIAIKPGPCEHDPVLDAKSGIHVCAKCGRGVSQLISAR
jgi:hypothetical protein